MAKVALVTSDEVLREAVSRLAVEAVTVPFSGELPSVAAGIVDLRADRASEIAHALARRGVPFVVVADEEAQLDAAPTQVVGALLRPLHAKTLQLHTKLALRLGAALERTTWLASALASASEPMIAADEAGHVMFMNAACEALTGWREADARGIALTDLLSFDAASGANSSSAAVVALPLRRKDGSTLLVEHSASPILDEAGALFGVVVVIRDVTARRALEVRVALADRLSSLGHLAGGVAHELNNPLAFVTSNLEFSMSEIDRMLESIPPGIAESLLDIRAALRDAAAGAARAAEIVKDMKTFTRTTIDGASATAIDINRVCSFASRIAGNEVRHRATLELQLHAEGEVRCDESALTQVFVNLLTNAAHAMATQADKHLVVLKTWSNADWTFAEVRDTGVGIREADRSRIFEPFFTTKPVGQGTGLGLALCHNIVTAAGGSLTFESTVGVGSAFMVKLPRTHEAASALPGAPQRHAPPAPIRVLVIDDEELIGAAIRRILTRAGIEVVFEGRGGDAVERLVRGEPFDCILCDLMMPNFSGADVHDAIAARAPAYLRRIAFMTGNAFAPRERELFANPENLTIEKPFLPDDLKRAVAKVIERHGRFTATTFG